MEEVVVIKLPCHVERENPQGGFASLFCVIPIEIKEIKKFKSWI
jgi:hypothetical protein